MSYFYAGYYLFPISACSFFDNLTVSTQPVPFLLYFFLFTQPVPFLLYFFLFGLSLYKFCLSNLCFLVYFFIQACIFFIYLVSFLSITSLKKDTTLCFHYSHPCRAQLYYIFLLVFSSIFFSYLTRAIVNTQKNGNSID